MAMDEQLFVMPHRAGKIENGIEVLARGRHVQTERRGFGSNGGAGAARETCTALQRGQLREEKCAPTLLLPQRRNLGMQRRQRTLVIVAGSVTVSSQPDVCRRCRILRRRRRRAAARQAGETTKYK